MKINAFIIIVCLGIFCPNSAIAQLSDSAINEIAQSQTDKWSQMFHFSKLREDKFNSIVRNHENKKSKIIMTSVRIKDLLKSENNRYFEELGGILTVNELKIYKSYLENQNLDSKSYFKTLMTAIKLEDDFINAFNQLQFNEVFPSLLMFRNEMDTVISRPDKIKLDSIRAQVFKAYDNCLLFCLADESQDSTLYEDLNDLFLVDLNKGLSNPDSDLSKLLKLTNKYQEQIHMVRQRHSEKYDYWLKKKKEIEQDYLLPNYVENLRKLQKNSPFASLVHLESEAIFLLLDPKNRSESLKILSLGFHHLY